MKIYVVRNKEGKYFRAKGCGYSGTGGGGKSWVDDLEKAKFYTKFGQAKSRVTFFFKTWPAYGCPDIIEWELDVSKATVLDMAEITNKSIKKIAAKDLQQEIRRKEWQKEALVEERKRLEQRLKDLQ